MKPKLSQSLAAALGALVVAALIFTIPAQSQSADTLAVTELPRHTHIHGLAVDRRDPSRLLIATHHGLFRAGPDGKGRRISEVQDFMGFTPHPRVPNVLYASGHPARGGNLGFVTSTDGGRTWAQISPGANGPVDFHQMTVSPADPRTMYGAYRGLQVSRDGGKTWRVVGPQPDGLIDLAASATSGETLYAATEAGLLVSKDAGRSWKPIIRGTPVTLVKVTRDGTLYAFVVGRGLVRSGEDPLKFDDLGQDFGGGVLMHLAVDPNDPNRLFAATGRGRVLMSIDQGRTWNTFGSPNS